VLADRAGGRDREINLVKGLFKFFMKSRKMKIVYILIFSVYILRDNIFA
jgi:hypothetical protein